jgi:hypothetical protein
LACSAAPILSGTARNTGRRLLNNLPPGNASRILTEVLAKHLLGERHAKMQIIDEISSFL